MSLLSLVLTLRPRSQASLPGALGRAAHAALLRAVAEVNPDLAKRLHDESMLRPFTCSSLLGSRPGGQVSPDAAYTLRYTALTTELATLLPNLFASLSPLARRPSLSEIELDGVLFDIEAITSEPGVHPWAARTSYEDLSAPWLLGRRAPETRLTLQLASPTAFKSLGACPALSVARAGLWQPAGQMERLCAGGLARRNAPFCKRMSGREPFSVGNARRPLQIQRRGQIWRGGQCDLCGARPRPPLVERDESAGRFCPVCRPGRQHEHGDGANKKTDWVWQPRPVCEPRRTRTCNQVIKSHLLCRIELAAPLMRLILYPVC